MNSTLVFHQELNFILNSSFLQINFVECGVICITYLLVLFHKRACRHLYSFECLFDDFTKMNLKLGISAVCLLRLLLLVSSLSKWMKHTHQEHGCLWVVFYTALTRIFWKGNIFSHACLWVYSQGVPMWPLPPLGTCSDLFTWDPFPSPTE